MPYEKPDSTGKARLLEAALELLADGGYAGATVNEICRRARVRPPSLYYHYGNKDGLVGVATETVAQAWLDELESAVATAGTFNQQLEAGLIGWRAWIIEPHSPVTLLLRLQLECPQTATVVHEALDRVMRRSRAIIAQTIEDSVGPVQGVDELAQSIVSLVQGAALRHHLDGDDANLNSRMAEMGRTISTLVESRRCEPFIKEKPQ